MKSRSNSRLYVTYDRYKEGVYFAKTDYLKFCRFYQTEYGWELWFYPYRVRRRAHSLTETLNMIDKQFKKFWRIKYGCN